MSVECVVKPKLSDDECANRNRANQRAWDDLEAYNALRASEKKKERIESIRMFLLGGLAAILFCVVFFGTNYLMHGYAI